MHAQNTRLQTAIEHLQHLPEKQQKVVFDVIETFFEIMQMQQSQEKSQPKNTPQVH